MVLSSKTSYDGLPLHLLELIVNHLSTSLDDLLNLRLVSKEWKAAVERCEAEISLYQREIDFCNICKSFPSLVRLELISTGSDFDLQTFTQCTRLSHLSLKTDCEGSIYDDAMPVDLSLLPATLRQLDILNCCLGTLNNIRCKCTNLTGLTIARTSDTPAEVCKLLQLLPHLQVRL